MGRLQSFERLTVVQAARDLFWDRGFDLVSLSDLEAATGLKRSSLYHAFGSKRGLFDAAVEDYQDTVIRPRLHILTGPTIGRDSLLAYFADLRSSLAALPGDSPRRGCLLLNCAAGLAGHDDVARQVVEGYRYDLTNTLQDALRVAGSMAGETVPDRSQERARTLASLGMSAMLLARVNATESVALLDTATDQIRSWFPEVSEVSDPARTAA